MNEIVPDSQLAEDSTPYYFPVSNTKLVLMSLATLGFYELYWFYKNWVFVKKREKSDISPFWRTVFTFFFVYPLFKQINSSASFFQLHGSFNPGWFAVAWIGLNYAARLPVPYFLVSYLSVLVILHIQTVVNQVNFHARPTHDPNDKFTFANYLIVVFGGIYFLFILVGTFLPDLPELSARTDNPRSYNNAGIVFDYPENWEVTEDEQQDGFRYLIVETPGDAIIIIHIYSADDAFEIRDFAQNFARSYQEAPPLINTSASVFGSVEKLNGYEVMTEQFSVTILGETMPQTRIYWRIAVDNKVGFIIAQVAAEDLSKGIMGFEQIISSFKYGTP